MAETQIMVEANGASIPAIGLGTRKLAGGEATTCVRHALDVGYRHIDTAAMYENEVAVGEGVRTSGVPRDQIWLTTKVWYSDIAEGALQRSAQASLKRLGLDYVDLLLIHWPNRDVPLDRSIRALNAVQEAGLARHIGVSNFTVDLLDKAVALSDAPIVANQCEYHPLLDQSAVLAACRRHGVAFTSYCPLGRGELVNDPRVREIADHHGRSAGQVLLRWHVQQPGVAAIPKSSNKDRIDQNLDVFGFALSAAEMATLSGLARADGRMVDPAWAPDWDGRA